MFNVWSILVLYLLVCVGLEGRIDANICVKYAIYIHSHIHLYKIDHNCTCDIYIHIHLLYFIYIYMATGSPVIYQYFEYFKHSKYSKYFEYFKYFKYFKHFKYFKYFNYFKYSNISNMSMRHCPCEGQGRCFRLWTVEVPSELARIDIAALEQIVLLAASTLDLEMVRQHDEVGKEKKRALNALVENSAAAVAKVRRLTGWKNIHVVEDVTYFCGWHDAWGNPERSLSWVTLSLFAKSHCIGSLKFGCAKGESTWLSA